MKTEITSGIQIHQQEAEKIRRYLSETKNLRNDLKIKKEGKFIYFPVKNTQKLMNSYKIIKKEFEKRTTKPKTYKEIISIPDALKNELPTSYDVIGDIILIKLPKDLLKFKKEIGKALLQSNKNIKTVCLSEPVAGELRTRNIAIIAGGKNTNTIHKEYGLSFAVDVQKTYFSPRLATERERVASLVKPREIVVDMFTGVAPFSIMIAKYADPKIIYAIDKNSEAVKYAKENIKKNNVLDKVEIIHADAKKIHRILEEKADRIIMNLPFSAHMFLKNTLRITKKNSIIHYYDILREEKIQERINEIKRISNENKTKLTNLNVRKIKTYAPREFYIGIDITATKNADVA